MLELKVWGYIESARAMRTGRVFMNAAKFRRFLKVYNGWVVLFGALIVAATFAVKDAWREKLKDDSDAADASLTIMSMRDDSRLLADELESVAKQIDDIQKNIEAKSQSAKPSQPIPASADKPPEVTAIYHALIILDAFADSYPYEDVRPKSQEFSKRLAALEALRLKYYKNEENETVAAEDPQMNLFMEIVFGRTALLNDIELYKGLLFLNSIETRADKKKEYEHATYYGYVLFGLGLIVTVLPKLLGAEEESSESDIFDLVA
jgi:hypothetical protein